MDFSDRIPDIVLEGTAAGSFVDVLDALQHYKTLQLAEGLRVFNDALLTNKKWLIARISEYGINLPYDLPIEVLIQFLLNADTITRLRGTMLGFELWLSVLTLGYVSIKTSTYDALSDLLLPNSQITGYITADTDDDIYYPCSDNDDIQPSATFNARIASIYAGTDYEDTILEYIDNHASEWLLFGSYEINIEMDTMITLYTSSSGSLTNHKSIAPSIYVATEPYFHELLNEYFIETNYE